ncbi:hypothetical protein Tco_1391704 [Tanacetum coccineum]
MDVVTSRDIGEDILRRGEDAQGCDIVLVFLSVTFMMSFAFMTLVFPGMWCVTLWELTDGSAADSYQPKLDRLAMYNEGIFLSSVYVYRATDRETFLLSETRAEGLLEGICFI